MGPGRELELRRELAAKCRACGTCRSVCPIFAEMGVEGAVARGKVVLIRAVLDGELDLTDLFDERIQLCLNCKACIASCPNDVRVDDLILAARSGFVEAGRLPLLKRIIFRYLLKRGRLLPPFGRFASFMQRFILRGLPEDSVYRKLLPIVGMNRDRIFPEFAPRSLIHSMPEVVPAQVVPAHGSAGGTQIEPGTHARIARDARRVGFFVGCATNLIYPETGNAIAGLLTRSGVDVVIPRNQGCCGAPAFNAGDYATGRELARKNIDVFNLAEIDAVVTGCASCGLSLKREYEETLGIEGGLGIPVFDFTEFLALRGGGLAGATAPHDTSASSARVRVTYHEPCHLSRGQGITDEPRTVIRSLPWVELVEMHDSDRCCGGGGSFSLTHYDLAAAIGEHKIEAIRATGADVVVTECPACVMQLKDMVVRYGLDVEVLSIADLLALSDAGADLPAMGDAGAEPGRAQIATGRGGN
ncbi:(Fe-S)-binding protein [bacterium]|nr:(Fe-S)-binding protein [bacterium]